MGWSNGVMTKPVGFGDISNAVHYSSLDLGTLIKYGSISEMARYKPFINGNPAFASDAAYESARAAARYGFGSIPTISPSTFQTAPARWTYSRPTAGQPSQWFRALDFDGYAEGCCPPFVLDMWEQYIAGQALIFKLLTNHRVDEAENHQYDFKGQYNLILEELLLSDRQSNEYVHLFIKKTSGTGSGTLNIVILTNDYEGTAIPLTALAPNNAQRLGVEAMIYLYPNGNGANFPAIPVLQSASSGDTFDVCAAFGTIPDGVVSGYYRVYTSIPSMTWKSLNLDGSNNLASFSMTMMTNNVSGSISYVLLQATSDYFTDPYDNHYRKFIIKAVRASVTTGTLNTGEAVNMNFTITFDGGLGTMYGRIGSVVNNDIVDMNTFTETFALYSNQSYTEYFCNESTGFTDRYFWALYDNDPDDTYQLGVSCVVARTSYPNVNLTDGASNVVHYTD